MLGHFSRLGLRDFDVETMDPVVFHLERADTGGFPFARFQIQQEVAAMGLDLTELIKVSIVAIGDNATITDVERRLTL